MEACRSGNLETVKYFVEVCKSKVNLMNNRGENGVNLALKSKNVNLIRFLVEDLGLDIILTEV